MEVYKGAIDAVLSLSILLDSSRRPDREVIAAGGRDKTLRIWGLLDGDLRHPSILFLLVNMSSSPHHILFLLVNMSSSPHHILFLFVNMSSSPHHILFLLVNMSSSPHRILFLFVNMGSSPDNLDIFLSSGMNCAIMRVGSHPLLRVVISSSQEAWIRQQSHGILFRELA